MQTRRGRQSGDDADGSRLFSAPSVSGARNTRESLDGYDQTHLRVGVTMHLEGAPFGERHRQGVTRIRLFRIDVEGIRFDIDLMDEVVIVAEQHGVAEGDRDLLQVEGACLLRDPKALGGDGDFDERHEAYDGDQKEPRPRKSAETGCVAGDGDADQDRTRGTVWC